MGLSSNLRIRSLPHKQLIFLNEEISADLYGKADLYKGYILGMEVFICLLS